LRSPWFSLGARRCGVTAHHAGSRSPPLDDTDQTAAARIRALVVFDARYDSAQLILALAEVRGDAEQDQARI
jgi:hypothetical protein